VYLRDLRGPQTPRDDENCAFDRCRGASLSATVVLVHQGTPWAREETIMTLHYSSPALDAELAYRREMLQTSGRGTRTRRGSWLRSRRRRAH
jgi:hypothetical protein